jgi:Fe-S-cluster-containing dehydrogenase component/DMSO reductase anchor subunit
MLAPNIHGFRTEGRETQTRFHFKMDACIACHACEVACNEQNGLPTDTAWRRVGEVEGGTFPDTKRFFVSTGCNHCLDAPCMKGCPVDAYQVTKRGTVIHLDDVCIGCQYCVWNCPYQVPVFQKDRNIVTKCDLCTNRLDQNLDPACVHACPANAIQIETVPLSELFQNLAEEGKGPDMPDPMISMSSTKITLPQGMKIEEFRKTDREFVKPEDPHSPLIWMTLLTQLGLGGFAFVFIADILCRFLGANPVVEKTMGWFSPSLMGIIALSLGASTLHLGRPAYAIRAIKNWRTSWLSREVIALSVFAGIAFLYSIALFLSQSAYFSKIPEWFHDSFRLTLGFLTVIAGGFGIFASSMLYRVPARPAWDVLKTTVDFFLVSCILGPVVFIFSVGISALILGETSEVFVQLCQAVSLFSLFSLLFKAALHSYHLKMWRKSSVFELSATVRLYEKCFSGLHSFKALSLVFALFFLFRLMEGSVRPTDPTFVIFSSIVFALLFCVCWVDRYLFFVTVVPKNIPGNFIMSANKVLNESRAS